MESNVFKYFFRSMDSFSWVRFRSMTFPYAGNQHGRLIDIFLRVVFIFVCQSNNGNNFIIDQHWHRHQSA